MTPEDYDLEVAAIQWVYSHGIGVRRRFGGGSWTVGDSEGIHGWGRTLSEAVSQYKRWKTHNADKKVLASAGVQALSALRAARLSSPVEDE